MVENLVSLIACQRPIGGEFFDRGRNSFGRSDCIYRLCNLVIFGKEDFLQATISSTGVTLGEGVIHVR